MIKNKIKVVDLVNVYGGLVAGDAAILLGGFALRVLLQDMTVWHAVDLADKRLPLARS